MSSGPWPWGSSPTSMARWSRSLAPHSCCCWWAALLHCWRPKRAAGRRRLEPQPQCRVRLELDALSRRAMLDKTGCRLGWVKPRAAMAEYCALSRPLRPRVGLLVIGLGTLLAPLDTAVNIAFPSITQAFALNLEDIRWVVVAYVLTYASLMLACGRLGDLVGYRPVFQVGLLISALGLFTCSMAPNYALLLGGRALQGLGIALTLSCGPALVTSLLPERERARALAFYAGVIAVGGALGPIVGGILVARWDWPSVFWFRVPIAVLALALSHLITAAP